MCQDWELKLRQDEKAGDSGFRMGPGSEQTTEANPILAMDQILAGAQQGVRE